MSQALAFCLITALLAETSAADDGGNLLRNPGFEEDNGYGYAEHWWYYEAAGRTTSAARDGLAGNSFRPTDGAAGGFGQDCRVDERKGRYLVFEIQGRFEQNYTARDTTVSIELWRDQQRMGAAATNVYADLDRDRGRWTAVRLTCGPVPSGIRDVKVHCAFGGGIAPEAGAQAACLWDDAVLLQVPELERADPPAPPEAAPPQGTAAGAPAGDNLAPNPGFEEIGDVLTQAPRGWSTFATHGQSIRATDVMRRSGERSLLIKTTGRAGSFQGLYCTLAVEEGRAYEFEAYVRSNREDRLDKTGHGLLMIEWYGPDEAVIRTDASATWDRRLSRLRWDRASMARARCPRGATSARFIINLSEGQSGGAGSILVDDVSIRRR